MPFLEAKTILLDAEPAHLAGASQGAGR
jgi:hypothetical protein